MERTFIGKNPSVLWFLLGLSLFTVRGIGHVRGRRHRADLDIVPQDIGQNPVPVPCGHRDGRGLGILWNLKPWTFRVLWDWRLRHWHVADV